MIFNVLAHNRDDHAKQQTFVMARNGTWRLAPAYDLTFSNGPGGHHYATVNGKGADIERADLIADAMEQGLSKNDASALINDVAEAVRAIPEIACDLGATKTMQIDVERATNATLRAALSDVQPERSRAYLYGLMHDTTAPAPTGLEQLRTLMASGHIAGIGKSLDFTLVEAEEGRVVFEGTPGTFAYNPIGTVHGGYAATLLDSACGCAVHSRLSATQAYTTLELKVAYHKAMTERTGVVRAEGWVVTIGRRTAFAEAKLVDRDGKLYASATSTLLVFDR